MKKKDNKIIVITGASSGIGKCTADMYRKIANGEKVILLGQDATNTSKKNSPFGPNNHYVLATGVDRRGNIIVNDRNLISNQILPEIEVKIRNIGNAISQEEQRLEAERRAQEEAARLAAQQAASNQNSSSSSNTTPSSNSKPSQPSVSKPNVSKPSKPASNNKMKNVSLTK